MRVRASRLILPLLIALLAPAAAMAQSVAPFRDGDRSAGLATAPVTLTVYLSATCSHCADWHTNDYPAIKARYVDTGKVRVVYRELPTPPFEAAVAGAVLARCAAQDRYDAVLDALYVNRSRLQADLVGWLSAGAARTGLSSEQGQACFTDDANWADIETRGQQALADGVESTPTFFINGELMPYAEGRDLNAFEARFEPLLTP